MDILSALLQSPGVYVGTGQDFGEPENDRKLWNARIEITPLPGGAAVSIDYECFLQEHGRFHTEHSVLGQLPEGRVLFVAHSHGDTVLLLHEDEPGHFVDRHGTSRFPVEHVIEVPEPGRIVHHWRLGRDGGEIEERDTADVRLVGR